MPADEVLPTISARDVTRFVTSAPLRLATSGEPEPRGAVVDLPGCDDSEDSVTGAELRELARSACLAGQLGTVLIGRAPLQVAPRWTPLVDALACTVVTGAATRVSEIAVPDAAAAAAAVRGAVIANPRAASTLTGLLRVTDQVPRPEGLIAESLAYSMLLAGPEFSRWRARRPRRVPPPSSGPAVLLERHRADLHITLNRPHRHNAFSRELRDGLVDALDLALLDDSLQRVVLAGNGPSFCSGGDLDEFGASTDVTTAHLIRLDRSVAMRAHQCGQRLEAHLHGACIGAGIEIPSFAARVVAAPDAYFQLPELAMGLVPGAGGTVGITARIGRWRTAYLALTGTRLPAATAVSWGLVDDVRG